MDERPRPSRSELVARSRALALLAACALIFAPAAVAAQSGGAPTVSVESEASNADDAREKARDDSGEDVGGEEGESGDADAEGDATAADDPDAGEGKDPAEVEKSPVVRVEPEIEPEADAQAQTTESAATDDGGLGFSQADRRRMYEQSKLSYGSAALWSLVFPGFGNFYAEDVFVGVLSMCAMGFGLIFIGYGFATNQNGYTTVGGVVSGLSYGLGMTTSLLAVRRHNDELRRNLNVGDSRASVRPDPDRPGVDTRDSGRVRLEVRGLGVRLSF
jgi:TM2 domain-containing membrane protein YozV